MVITRNRIENPKIRIVDFQKTCLNYKVYNAFKTLPFKRLRIAEKYEQTKNNDEVEILLISFCREIHS